DLGGRGSLGHGGPIGHSKQRGGVEKFLGAMSLKTRLQLVGEATGASGEVECHGGKDRNHGVIRMARNRAFWSHRHDYVRTQLPHATCEVLYNRHKVLPVKAGIRIIEDGAARNLQQPARRSKFLAPHMRKLIIGLGSSPMRRCLARRETEHMCLYSALSIM